MEKTFSFETTGFDFAFINHVKIIRINKKLSGDQLSLKMGVAKSFVSNVESYTQRHKYSTRHISLLAKAFGYKNISELMNFPTPEYDRIKVTVKQVYNESGTKVMESEVVGIERIR
ncbi:helix-turn-helix transcriptional regulator [uncultured Chryseobacterium sp.]|uniref:helix-turn-helix domain-containing protein n=1 Tax=uncultured Chryseobacterium sp. TaxID=259322 RepID=UPI0025DA5BA8|nr:helix-turn-helix transcriptional regulator [uncultured Chryseobacterium sp.]